MFTKTSTTEISTVFSTVCTVCTSFARTTGISITQSMNGKQGTTKHLSLLRTGMSTTSSMKNWIVPGSAPQPVARKRATTSTICSRFLAGTKATHPPPPASAPLFLSPPLKSSGNDGGCSKPSNPVPPCVGYYYLAESFWTGWSPRGRGSAKPVARPTLDGQVLQSTRRSSIIGLDTLPLQTPG